MTRRKIRNCRHINFWLEIYAIFMFFFLIINDSKTKFGNYTSGKSMPK